MLTLVLNIIGWVLWSITLMFALGVLSSRSSDGGVRWMMQVQGLVLLVACAATLFLSKFWLLAAFPVSGVLPLYLMQHRASRSMARVEALMRAGVPIEDVLRHETRGMTGENERPVARSPQVVGQKEVEKRKEAGSPQVVRQEEVEKWRKGSPQVVGQEEVEKWRKEAGL